MKKLFAGILIFAIISIGVTGVLIKVENDKAGTEKNEISNVLFGEENKEQNEKDEPSEVIEEKTLDLYGTYDENDIVMEEIEEKIDLANLSININIPTIKGLKNKAIEEKINNDIKKQLIENVKEISQRDNIDISDINVTTYVSSNFSNVVSYQIDIGYKNIGADFREYECFCLNYELVNGEKLKFEDLFAQDADLYSIVRRMFYRQASKESLGGEMDGSTYYDEESGKWLRDTWDPYTGEEIKIEYIPNLDEYEISKKIETFMQNNEKEFYFSPTRIYIVDGEIYYSYFLYFKDIADDVVIYDKYLTKESIYENSNIGFKNLWTCSKPANRMNHYLEYGFAEDNLYYEISMTSYSNSEEAGYPFLTSLNKVKKQLVESATNKIEEYRKIAKENPNEFYVLSINPYYAIDEVEFDNQIFTKIEEYLTTTNIEYKKDVMDELLASYRYYNLGFYRSALEHAGYMYNRTNDKYYEGNIVFNSFVSKLEAKVYDARSLKELTSLDEVFRDGVDYMSMIQSKLKNKITRYSYVSEEELNNLINEATYTLGFGGIIAKLPNEREYTIYYSEFDKSILKVYDLEMYIIQESNVSKIEKSEIDDLSLEDLNRAYNEIFARHGHDFKNKELKEYFELCSWYTPITNKSVSLEELNDIEKYNLDIIKSVISDRK